MAQSYRAFEELAKHERECVDYQIRVHRRLSDITILAPCGGKIEPGTSELAEYIAGDDFSFYTFEGIASGHNGRLRLSGEHFDEPQCLEILKGTRFAVVIHGLRAASRSVQISGAYKALRGRLAEMLAAARFDATEDESEACATALCNRAGPGLRIAIGKKLRDDFEGHPREMDRFVACIRSVLIQEALERRRDQQEEQGVHAGPATD